MKNKIVGIGILILFLVFCCNSLYGLMYEDYEAITGYGIKTQIYSLDEAKTTIDQLDNQSYNIEYECKNDLISETTWVDRTIELTDEFEYGKAFYLNKTSEIINFSIIRTDVEIEIPPFSAASITWRRGGITDKTYIVSVSIKNKSMNLNGNITVFKMDSVD